MVEQMCIIYTKFCMIVSRLARSMADLVCKNDHFLLFLRMTVLKVEDDQQCAKHVSPMRAVLLA